MSIRLLIADDQEVTRAGLRAFFSGSEVEVVAEATTAAETLERARATRPEVVLLAARLAGQDALELLDVLAADIPGVAVLVTSPEKAPGQVSQARERGAAAVVVKSLSRDELVEMVRAAAQGEDLWKRPALRRLAASSADAERNRSLDVALSAREWQVLDAVVLGRTNAQIADQLQISSETVKEHVQHILRKVGVSDRTQAALWAVRQGLVRETLADDPARPDRIGAVPGDGAKAAPP